MGVDLAILCSGASFNRFIERPRDHELFIGVNRMAADVACDWWVFNDGAAFEWHTPLRRCDRPPTVCTTQAILDRLRRSEKVSAQQIRAQGWLTVETLRTSCPTDTAWVNYSLTVALVLAESLGARAITLYGCDWKGSLDFDGRKPPRGGRDAYRWENELHKVGHVLLWLARQGVCVRRLRVDGTFEELNKVLHENKDEAEVLTPAPAQPLVHGSRLGADLPQPTAEPARHTMRLKRKLRIGREELQAGTVLAGIDLYPPCTLNMLSRGMEDGVIAKLE